MFERLLFGLRAFFLCFFFFFQSFEVECVEGRGERTRKRWDIVWGLEVKGKHGIERRE